MSNFLSTFSDKKSSTSPPFWFMRQAGRYLPEYQEIRSEMKDFLDLCYTPEKAMEVTLQPLKRFDMDAAIIFSDILVIPDALGSNLRFIKGEGPQMDTIQSKEDIKNLNWNPNHITEFLSPVYEALALTKQNLPKEKALIGFAGAPWTIACYMLQGRGGGEFLKAREVSYTDPELVESLIEKLTGAIATHLIMQVKAGADTVQLFDSWAGFVPEPLFESFVIQPTQTIVKTFKKEYPEIPFIGFPKGIGEKIPLYASETGIDGLSVDMTTSLSLMDQQIDKKIVLQGNLDPLLLATCQKTTVKQAKIIKAKMQNRPFIFNLGHGMLPHTPIENVEALVKAIRE